MNKAEIIKSRIYPLLAIAFVGFLIYSNALRSEFQFDDWSFLVQNPDIYHLQNTQAIPSMHRGRPIPTFTFALDYYFSGLNPLGYHVTNLIIHLISAWMVWWLMRLILSTPLMIHGESNHPNLNHPNLVGSDGWCRHKEWLALLTAFLFLSHPVQTNVVTYINQRYSSLSAMFYLISFCLYVRGRLGFSSRHQTLGCFLGSALAAILGMFSKETLIMLPGMIIVSELYFFGLPSWKEISRKKFFWAAAFIFLGIALIIPFKSSFNLSAVLQQQFPSASHDGDMITSHYYLLTQFRVLVTYLKVLFMPVNLQFDYDFPLSKTFFEASTFFSFLFLCLVWAAAVKTFTRYRIISFGIVWFFLNLAIESSIIPIPHVIWEYRLYLPSVGFFMVLSGAIYYLIRDQKKVISILTIIILMFCYLTFERNKVWQNEIVFWQDNIQKAPHKARPYDNLAAAYLKRGDYQEAIKLIHIALRLNPENFETYNNLGQAYTAAGDYDQAIYYLRQGLEIKPEAVPLINNLGVAYLKKNDTAQAEREFLRAVKLSGAFYEPASNLAELYYKKGEIDKSIHIYRQVVKLFPHQTSFLYTLTKLYLEKKDYAKALETGNAIVSNVRDPLQLLNAGGLFAQHKAVDMAIQLFYKALQLAPKDKRVYLEIGKLFGNLEEFDQAIAIWREGQRLDPRDKTFDELIGQANQLKESAPGADSRVKSAPGADF